MKPSELRAAERAAKRLVGRTITAVDLRPFHTENANDLKDQTCDPVLTLDDGTRIAFFVTEAEIMQYGVELVITRTKRQPRARKSKNSG